MTILSKLHYSHSCLLLNDIQNFLLTQIPVEISYSLFFNQLIVLVKIIIIIWKGFLSVRKPVRF